MTIRATHEFTDLDAAREFVKRTRAELRALRNVRVGRDWMQIIDVNTGVFAADEFLFDTRHAPQFVVEELARRYSYLLLWGGRHTPHPTPSQIRKLLMHYLYCYAVTLCRHFTETALVSKIRDLIESLAALSCMNRRSNPREQ